MGCIPSQNGKAILILMEISERATGILKIGQFLRLSFCRSALYRWHRRAYSDLTGHRCNGDEFEITAWQHPPVNATPAMSRLELFIDIQAEEMATLMPLPN